MKRSLLDLNVLHILNDGFKASLVLLLPFIAKDLALSLTQVGGLGGAVSVIQIILALPAALIAARLGGMKTLLIAMFLYGLGYLGTSLAPAFPFLAIAFLLAGTGFGAFHPIAFALLARIVKKERVGRTLGNFTALGDMGIVAMSSILTLLVVRIGWRPTAFLYALLPFILLLILWRRKDNLIVQKKEAKKIASGMHLRHNYEYILSIAASAIDSLASASIYLFMPFLFLARGVTPAFLGVFTASYFAGNMLGKTSLGRLSDVVEKAHVFIAAEVVMAVFLVLIAMTHSFVLMIIFSIILGAMTKGTGPVVTTMVTNSLEKYPHLEKAFGIGSVISGAGSTLAPLILGYAADRYGIESAFFVSACFALLATIPAIVLLIHKRRK